jgi:hypothetical protein
LELVDLETLLQQTFRYETKEDDTFEVERIIAHRSDKYAKEFLVKWLGYDDSENIWELETNLTNYQ